MTALHSTRKRAAAAARTLCREVGQWLEGVRWGLLALGVCALFFSPIAAIFLDRAAAQIGSRGSLALAVAALGGIGVIRALVGRRVVAPSAQPREAMAALRVPAGIDALREEIGHLPVEAARHRLPIGAGPDELRPVAAEIAENSVRHDGTRGRGAQHEAAHVVVAHVLGATLVSVRVNMGLPRMQLDGSAESTVAGTGARGVDAAWASLQMALAGWVWDTDYQGVDDFNSGLDMHTAAGRITQILVHGTSPADYVGPLTYDGLLAAALARVRCILAERADLVRAVGVRIHDSSASLGERDLADLW